MLDRSVCLFFCLLTLSVRVGALELADAATGTPRSKAASGPVIRVHLELERKAGLTPAEIQWAVFPSGKHCGFHFGSVKQAKNIALYSKMGFRTTVTLGPDTPLQTIREFEEAGADIEMPVGNGGSQQENLEAVALMRTAMKKLLRGPVLGCPSSDPKGDDDGVRILHGHTREQYHHCNLLVNPGFCPYGYHVTLRRSGGDNAMRSIWNCTNSGSNSASEVIFYQTLSHMFLGTLKLRDKTQLVNFPLGDFKEADFEALKPFIEKYGTHPLIWHATDGEIAGYEYLKRRSHVLAVREAGETGLDVDIELEPDTFTPFLLSPLTLKLPKAFPVKAAKAATLNCLVTEGTEGVEGTFVDVPVQKLLRGGCEMSLATSAPNMTVPDDLPVTLTIKNTSDQPMENTRLEWVGTVGIALTGGTQESFSLEPKAERKVEAVVHTVKGAWFGIAPIQALLRGTSAGMERTWTEGFEINVAPRLGLNMDPVSTFTMAKGRVQPVLVHVSNGGHSPTGAGGQWLHHKTGPCKGVVTWKLPEGMEADPPEQPFEFTAEIHHLTFIFKIKNNVWSKTPIHLAPQLRFAGESDPIQVVYKGVEVIRDQELLDYQALDELGTTLYASWDDPRQKANACNKAVANGLLGKPTDGPPGSAFWADGVSKWCLSSSRICFFSSWKTVDYEHGTVLFWTKKDPTKRNENQYRPDRNETWKQKVGASGSWELPFGGDGATPTVCNIGLRRFPGWDGKKGYWEAVYAELGDRKRHFVQVDFDWNDDWHQVGMLWDINAKRLEIYIDGKLAGKADPGTEDWFGLPWDLGKPNGAGDCGWSAGSTDHGKLVNSLLDEYYIFNKALKPEEIFENYHEVQKWRK